MPVYIAHILVPQVVAIESDTIDNARTRLTSQVRASNGRLLSLEPAAPEPPPPPLPPEGEAA